MALEDEPIPGSEAWMKWKGMVRRPDGSWKPRSEIEEKTEWKDVQRKRGPRRSRD